MLLFVGVLSIFLQHLNCMFTWPFTCLVKTHCLIKEKCKVNAIWKQDCFNLMTFWRYDVSSWQWLRNVMADINRLVGISAYTCLTLSLFLCSRWHCNEDFQVNTYPILNMPSGINTLGEFSAVLQKDHMTQCPSRSWPRKFQSSHANVTDKEKQFPEVFCRFEWNDTVGRNGEGGGNGAVLW